MRCVLWKADLIGFPVSSSSTSLSAGKYTKELGRRVKAKRQVLQLRAQGNNVQCISSIAIGAAEELKCKLLQENSFNTQSPIVSSG